MRLILPVLLGGFVTFPVPLPGGPPGLRTTEVVNSVANLCFLVTLLSGRPLHRAAVPLAIAGCLSIIWMWAELVCISLNDGGGPARMIFVRWIMSLATSYWLVVLMENEQHRAAVGLGMAVGLVFAMISLTYDAATYDPGRVVLQLDDEERVSWINGEYRASGAFGHPNSAAATSLLFVPLVIGYIEEKRLPLAAVFLTIIAMGAVFYVTKSRGPIIVSSVLLLWFLRSILPVRWALLLPALGLLLWGTAQWNILPLPATSNVFLERLSDAQNIAEGAHDRFETILASVYLTLNNPLGLGSRYEPALIAATTSGATHNAYLQLALLGGIPIALFVVTRLLATGLLPPVRRDRKVEGWIAAYTAGAFFFENLFFVPSFVIMTLWLIWRPPEDD